MMDLCQFGQKLAVDSEDRVQTSIFNRVIYPGDNNVKVMKI